MSEIYRLKRPSLRNRSEIVFLREDDVVHFPSTESRLALTLDFDDIQVNSSAPAESSEVQDLDPQSLPSKRLSQGGILSRDNEVVIEHSDPQHFVPLPKSTPIPSVSRSEVVEETPASRHKQFMFVENSSFTAPQQESEATGDCSISFLHYSEHAEGPQLLDESANPKRSMASIEPFINASQGSENGVQKFSTPPAGVSQQQRTASEHSVIEETGSTDDDQDHSVLLEMPESIENMDTSPSVEPPSNMICGPLPLLRSSDAASFTKDNMGPSLSSTRSRPVTRSSNETGSTEDSMECPLESTRSPLVTTSSNVIGSTEDSMEDKDEELEETPRQGRRVVDGVHIPSPNKSAKKRPSPGPSSTLDTDEEEVRGLRYTRRPIKRTKMVDGDSQDSRLDEIVVDTRLQGSIPKVQRRGLSDTAETPTPVALQASQRSAAEKDLYDVEEPPRVVFSNSTVSDKPQLLKFLHQHGGSVVDKVSENNSNVLW